MVPVLDAAHLISGDPAAGGADSAIFTQGSIPELVAPRTKLNFEEEYLFGLERQVKGFVVSARYTDRRLLRIIEDMSGASPEGYRAGVPQLFRIGNPSATSDYFVNEIEQPYVYIPDPNNTGYHGQRANCPLDSGQQDQQQWSAVRGCGLHLESTERRPHRRCRNLSWRHGW